MGGWRAVQCSIPTASLMHFTHHPSWKSSLRFEVLLLFTLVIEWFTFSRTGVNFATALNTFCCRRVGGTVSRGRENPVRLLARRALQHPRPLRTLRCAMNCQSAIRPADPERSLYRRSAPSMSLSYPSNLWSAGTRFNNGFVGHTGPRASRSEDRCRTRGSSRARGCVGAILRRHGFPRPPARPATAARHSPAVRPAGPAQSPCHQNAPSTSLSCASNLWPARPPFNAPFQPCLP